MNGERVIVTGGAGFIGSALVRELLRDADRSIEVLNLDALTYAANLASLVCAETDARYSLQRVDLRDSAAVHAAVADFAPSQVFHLAAETHVDRSLLAESAFVETNVLGTTHLLQATRKYWESLPEPQRNTFRLIHVSTDEVFGSLGPQGEFGPDSAYAPNSPYSASKAAADHLARAWYHSYGLPVCIANASNTYGPCQFPEKLIPFMIVRGLAEQSMPLYGDGSQVRDWIHVEDHVAALLAIQRDGQAGESYLIGAEQERSNRTVVELIARTLDEHRPLPNGDTHGSLIECVEDRPGHDFRYAMDTSRTQASLNWQPHWQFEAGLRATVAWYLEHPDWLAAANSEEYRAWIEANYAWR